MEQPVTADRVQPKTGPPRHVTVLAHVDGSMTKPQLMKLKKVRGP